MLAGGHVLAAGGDEDVLLAVDDLQEAVVGEAADVAGLEPAVVGEGLAGGLGILVVAGEDDRAAGEDLAVLGELAARTEGKGLPTVSKRKASGRFMVSVGEVSVSP